MGSMCMFARVWCVFLCRVVCVVDILFVGTAVIMFDNFLYGTVRVCVCVTVCVCARLCVYTAAG